MSKYDGAEQTNDYMQIIYAIGFVVMFSVATPFLTVLLAVITLRVQRRADAWKLIKLFRRTYPDMDVGIGTWNSALMILNYAGIWVNILLIVMNCDMGKFCSLSPFLEHAYADQPWLTKSWIFLVAVIFFSTCAHMFHSKVPNERARTTLSKRRQALQRERLYSEQQVILEKITMWAKGDPSSSAFEKTPSLKPGDDH